MNITPKIGELIDEIETSSQNQVYDVELINTGMIEIDNCRYLIFLNRLHDPYRFHHSENSVEGTLFNEFHGV